MHWFEQVSFLWGLFTGFVIGGALFFYWAKFSVNSRIAQIKRELGSDGVDLIRRLAADQEKQVLDLDRAADNASKASIEVNKALEIVRATRTTIKQKQTELGVLKLTDKIPSSVLKAPSGGTIPTLKNEEGKPE